MAPMYPALASPFHSRALWLIGVALGVQSLAANSALPDAVGIEFGFAPTSDNGTLCTLADATSRKPRSCTVIGQGRNSTEFLQSEVGFIDQIIAARLADKTYLKNGSDPTNKYKIRYSNYNLLQSEIVPRLVKAFNMGVYIQVLIEFTQIDPCKTYQPLVPEFKAGGLNVPCFSFTPGAGPACGNPKCVYNSATCSMSPDQDCSSTAPFGVGTMPTQLSVADAPSSYNLLPIVARGAYSKYTGNTAEDFSGWHDVGIMHTKMRLFDWEDSATGNAMKLLVTGSLNPDDSAIYNDETYLVVQEPAIIADYERVYNAVMTLGRPKNASFPEQTYQNPKYNESAAFNVVFSKGEVNDAEDLADVLVDMISRETELVLISVYTMRDFGGFTAALASAAKNGAFVGIITDVGEVVGEIGFAVPDPNCTAVCWNNILLDAKTFGAGVNLPVYPGKNANSMYSAVHHKNMVIGVGDRMRIVTDTTNWSTSGAGSTDAPRANSCCGQGCKLNAAVSASSSFPSPSSSSSPSSLSSPARHGKTASWNPPSTNGKSYVSNCETALILSAKSGILGGPDKAASFVDNWLYLLFKIYEYNYMHISEITNIDGDLIFPESNFTSVDNSGNASCLTIATEQAPPYPASVSIPRIFSPTHIAELMLKSPAIATDAQLGPLIRAYAAK